MAALQAQNDGLVRQFKGKAPATIEELVQNTYSPFTADVMRVLLARKFKMPQIDTFNGFTDPFDHLETYKNLMMPQALSDVIMCRAFSAHMWFNKIKPNSIRSFKKLSENFVSYFIAGQKYNKPSTYLFSIKQGKNESLQDYTSKFTKESM